MDNGKKPDATETLSSKIVSLKALRKTALLHLEAGRFHEFYQTLIALLERLRELPDSGECDEEKTP